MNGGKPKLKDFTARYLVEHLGYERHITEDLAQDFVNDDFPANRIRTIPEAAAYLDDLILRIRPTAEKARQERS